MLLTVEYQYHLLQKKEIACGHDVLILFRTNISDKINLTKGVNGQGQRIRQPVALFCTTKYRGRRRKSAAVCQMNPMYTKKEKINIEVSKKIFNCYWI